MNEKELKRQKRKEYNRKYRESQKLKNINNDEEIIELPIKNNEDIVINSQMRKKPEKCEKSNTEYTENSDIEKSESSNSQYSETEISENEYLDKDDLRKIIKNDSRKHCEKMIFKQNIQLKKMLKKLKKKKKYSLDSSSDDDEDFYMRKKKKSSWAIPQSLQTCAFTALPFLTRYAMMKMEQQQKTPSQRPNVVYAANIPTSQTQQKPSSFESF